MRRCKPSSCDGQRRCLNRVRALRRLSVISITLPALQTEWITQMRFLVVPHRSNELHFHSPGFKQEVRILTPERDTKIGEISVHMAQSAEARYPGDANVVIAFV